MAAEGDAMTREQRLEHALHAVLQFMPADVERGPDSNGWQNSMDLASGALALTPHPEAPARTLENIAMFARRGLSCGNQATPQTPSYVAAKRGIMLEAILQACEHAGVVSSPLRESPSPPTEADQ